jgi:hypothetical protein
MGAMATTYWKILILADAVGGGECVLRSYPACGPEDIDTLATARRSAGQLRRRYGTLRLVAVGAQPYARGRVADVTVPVQPVKGRPRI